MFFSMSNKVTKREENKYKIKNEWPKIGLNASKEFKFDIELWCHSMTNGDRPQFQVVNASCLYLPLHGKNEIVKL